MWRNVFAHANIPARGLDRLEHVRALLYLGFYVEIIINQALGIFTLILSEVPRLVRKIRYIAPSSTW